MKNIIRSVSAVLAGLVVLTVLSFVLEGVTNALLARAFSGPLPDPSAPGHNVPVRLFDLLLTLASVAAGGYVTAWLANPSTATRHAVILGVMEVIMTIGAMFALGNAAPLWSWIAAIIFIIPAAWLGSHVRTNNGT